MIGAQYFQRRDDPFDLESADSDRLLSLYGDSRMLRHKLTAGSSILDDPKLPISPLLSLGLKESVQERSIRIEEDPSLNKSTEYLKSQTGGLADVLKQGNSKFSKHDPRRVAVSWYSYHYLRPGSPTQWDQREDTHTDSVEHLEVVMGMQKEECVSSDPDSDVPVKSDIALLEKLSNMADSGLVDQADLEVADIYSEKDRLIRHYSTGQFQRWSDLEGETKQLLHEMRRSSPPL